jgi:hypothetical protein
MAFQPAELSDRDFLMAYLAEYLDEELSPELKTRFEKLLASDDLKTVPERYQKMRGKLQLSLQGYYLKNDEKMRLHEYVEDRTARETIEAERITQVERHELLGNTRRSIVIIAAVAVMIFGFVYMMTPREPQKFEALEYLGYEALAMEEDTEGRLDLPSHDLAEIRKYLETNPALGFKARLLKELGAGWVPDGASVIDYETAKVAVVQYGNETLSEKMFFFALPGNMTDLPRVDQGNLRGLIYQTYSSDQLNTIVWQIEKGILAFMVGRRSAPELASLARSGMEP